MLVSAWVGLRFFVASFERGSSGLVRCEKSIGKKRGWRSRLPGLSSPARATTRSSPYGVYKHNRNRSEEHTSELQSQSNLVCRLLLEKKNKTKTYVHK